MKKTLHLLLGGGIALTLGASLFAVETVPAPGVAPAALVDDASYAYEKLPAELAGACFLGKDIEFQVEENATTGYIWNAAYDPRVASVEIRHKAAVTPGLAGAPGFAKVEIRPLTTAQAVVTLYYARPFEPGVKPIKSVKIVVTPVNPAGGAAPAPAAAPTHPTAPTAPSAPLPPPLPNSAPALGETLPPSTATEINDKAIPMLKDDATYRLSNLPPVLKAVIGVGQELEFDLIEQPSAGQIWSLGAVDQTICKVKLEHDKPDTVFGRHKAEVELKGRRAGATTLELISGSGASTKRFMIHITVL